MSSGDWFLDLRIVLIYFVVRLISEVSYLVWFLSSVLSSGVEEMLSRDIMDPFVTTEIPFGVAPRNNHIWILTQNFKKHTRYYLFYKFAFSTSWLFWFMMKCDGCFNKDMLSLFWRKLSVFCLVVRHDLVEPPIVSLKGKHEKTGEIWVPA